MEDSNGIDITPTIFKFIEAPIENRTILGAFLLLLWTTTAEPQDVFSLEI
jgi:hypothetical protein